MAENNPVTRRSTILGAPVVDKPGPETVVAAPAKPARASRMVVLGLLGVGALAGGYFAHDYFASDDEPQEATQRNGYTTKEECEKNYTKEQCTPGQTYRSGVGFIPIFWGPYYRDSTSMLRSPADPGPGRFSRGSVVDAGPAAPASRRGGFGTSASGHGTGSAGT